MSASADVATDYRDRVRRSVERFLGRTRDPFMPRTLRRRAIARIAKRRTKAGIVFALAALFSFSPGVATTLATAMRRIWPGFGAA